MITTIDGMRDEAELRHAEIITDNDNEYTVVTEYWDGDRLVHRSAHVTLKQVGVIAEALAASLG